MTVVVYMLWFVGMAIATAAILTIGILSAADIIRWQRPRRRAVRPHSRARPRRTRPSRRLNDQDSSRARARGRRPTVAKAATPPDRDVRSGPRSNGGGWMLKVLFQ